MHIYWNKLALIIRNKTQSARESISIFTKSISYENLRYSVDMWYLYCEFITNYSAEFSDSDIRSIFEEALQCVGSFYQSDSIWSLYINWEERKGNYKQVSNLFPRVLTQQIRNLEEFWNSFLQHIKKYPIEDVITIEEHNYIEQLVSDIVEKEDLTTFESINEARRTLTFDLRHKKYTETIQKLSEKLYFEMKLKRSYFHFDLPNNSQISNWIQYISLNESLENNEITKNLYERCLIPCYLIPEIWIKYSLFILNIEGEEESLKILNRAFNSPLKIHSKFLYLYGTFLESINQLNLSNEIFEKLINLPINFEIEFYYYLYKLRIGENNINRLEFFLENTNNPIDITIISGLLIKLNKNINLNKLIEKCSSISNSLNIISKILLKENKINELQNIYHLYLIDNKSKLSLKNKL